MRTKGVCGLSVDGGAGASKFSSAQRWGGACCVDCYAEMFTFGCLLLAAGRIYFSMLCLAASTSDRALGKICARVCECGLPFTIRGSAPNFFFSLDPELADYYCGDEVKGANFV